MRLCHTRLRFRFASRGTRFAPSCLAPSTTLRRGRMRRSVLVALLALAGACRERPDVAGPPRAGPRPQTNVLGPPPSSAAASAAPPPPLGFSRQNDEAITTPAAGPH